MEPFQRVWRGFTWEILKNRLYNLGQSTDGLHLRTYAYCQNCIGIACLGSLISLRRGECDWKCFATELAATTELIVNIRRNDEDS